MKPSNAISLFLLAVTNAAVIEQRQAVGAYPAPHNNDFSCNLQKHPNPVIFLHGLGATYYEDLNVLQTNLEGKNFCGFAKTYGSPPGSPFIGGLRHIEDSAQEIASFVKEVKTKTGAAKVDLVGHSEGAFQSLYVPKTQPGISEIVDKIVAIAPPTHGTSFANLYNLAYIGGNLTRAVTGAVLDTFGCPACNDLGPDGAAVKRLNDGKPIKQPGNQITVIISKNDQLVTPVDTARVNEDGVRNIYVQDRCPNDQVGHIGEAYDQNVWALVANSLDPNIAIPKTCVQGMPY